MGITPPSRARDWHGADLRGAAGFQQVGLPRVYLEVTAQNDGAVRLYKRLGFAHEDAIQGGGTRLFLTRRIWGFLVAARGVAYWSFELPAR